MLVFFKKSFYKREVNNTSVEILIFIKKRSILLVLNYIFYKKEVKNTSVELYFL